jgi:peptide chain release factor 2
VTVFDLRGLETKSRRLTEETLADGFWESERARDVSRELSSVQARIDEFGEFERELEELQTLALILSEGEDAELQSEFYERAKHLDDGLSSKKIYILLDEEYDISSSVVTIHAGSGGLDSQDWCEMLFRMYVRWAEARGYGVKILDELRDQEAGIKSVTFEVEGDYAYGYLKGEQGVHRLVRISPFDAAHRRHTSFTSVEVLPILPDSVEIEIRPEDLKTDTYRSSGAGGQHVNMTDSAIRITHVPTGIIVSCQVERSQHMNRAIAMQVLRSRLFERTMRERREQIESLQGEKRSITWGSQIRSYTLQPFQLVKDHRSNFEAGNVNAILDGGLDDLMIAYLRFAKTGNAAASSCAPAEEGEEFHN